MASRMRTASFELPEQLDNELSIAAAESGTSRSAVVQQALERALLQPNPSLLEVAGDLIGSLDWPTDLSHNPEHLSAFAR